MMFRLLLSLLYLGAADALHYVEGAAATTEEVFANGTYSYAMSLFLLLDWPIRIFANIVRPPGQSESSLEYRCTAMLHALWES